MPKYLNSRLKELAYWTCAMEHYFTAHVEHVTDPTIERWLHSTAISLRGQAKAILGGCDDKQVKSLLNMNTGREPRLVIKSPVNVPKDEYLVDLIWDLAEAALDRCQSCENCGEEVANCPTRQALEAFKVPAYDAGGECPYR